MQKKNHYILAALFLFGFVFADNVSAAEEPTVWGKTKDVASDMWDGTKEVTSDVWDGTKEVTSDVWKGTKQVGSDIKDGLSGDQEVKNEPNKSNCAASKPTD